MSDLTVFGLLLIVGKDIGKVADRALKKGKEDFIKGNGYGKKPTSNPDYLIDGEAFDCYSPDGSNIRNIWSTVEQKVEKQAERIVLNLDDYSGSVDDLYKQFKEWDIGDLKVMLVIKDGNITRWMP